MSSENGNGDWDDALNTGVAIIDQQHQALARLGSELLANREWPLGSEMASDLLARFFEMVAHHFDTEESIMDQMDLPALIKRDHVEEHSVLLERLVSLNYVWTHELAHKRLSHIAGDLIAIIRDHVVKSDLPILRNSRCIALAE